MSFSADQTSSLERLQRKLLRETRARKEAEKLLEEKSEELYLASRHAEGLAKAMGAAADGIALTDENGLFSYMNAAHARMFGYNIEDLLGKNWSVLYDEQALENFSATITPKFESTGFWQGDVIGLHSSGSPVYQNISLTALDDGGRICASRDITERRRRELMILEMETRLHDAERSATIDIVSSVITHDLNNIIAAISGYAFLMKSELNIDPKLPSLSSYAFLMKSELDSDSDLASLPSYAFLMKSELDSDSKLALLAERVIQATQQAVGVVESLKSNSVEDQVDSEPLSIAQLLQASMLIANGFRPEEISISSTLESNFTLITHEILLSRCLLNIFKNTFEAISGPGEVHIRACEAEALQDLDYDHSVSVGYPGEHNDGVIEVVDNGCGINEADLKKIFNPFFTTKKSRSGRGLGMQSLKALADQDLAYVTVSSSVDKGTCVRIYFHEPHNYFETTLPITKRNPSNRIVIVDDDSLVGEMLLQTLTKLDYEAQWYSDPLAALATIDQDNPQLLITDYNMPELNGDELAREVKRISPSTRIILYSGQTEDLRSHSIYSSILKKPISPQQLDLAIQKAISD